MRCLRSQDGMRGDQTPPGRQNLLPFAGLSTYPWLHLYSASAFTLQPMIAPPAFLTIKLRAVVDAEGRANPFGIVPSSGPQSTICMRVYCNMPRRGWQ